ncbi:uncharacterized protein PAF06_014404 [Gastrophryne carolinensis]
MRTIVLCSLLALLLLQGAESDTPNQSNTGSEPQQQSNLRCHTCVGPNACKKYTEPTPCKDGEDTCQKSYRVITDPDGSPDRNNDYESTTKGTMVMERLCTTTAKCEKAQKRTSTLLKVDCCPESGCNA